MDGPGPEQTPSTEALAPDEPVKPPVQTSVNTGENNQPAFSMPEMDHEGNLASDVHCRRCGYNLRGLKPEGACPECELPTSRSIFGDWLGMCDPAWIKRLKTGIHLLLGSIFGSIAFWTIFIVALMIIDALTAGAALGAIQTIMMILTMILGLIWFAGAWMLTTPDPGAEQIESPRSARSLARWCSVAAIAAMPLSVLQQSGMNLAAPAPVAAPLDTILLALSTLLGTVGIIATAAGVIYLRSLALRIPARSLATQTRIAGWGYVVVACLGQAQGLLMLLLMPGFIGAAGGPGGAGGAGGAGGGMPVMFILWGFMGCALILATMVFGIWMIVLLCNYATAFNKALVQAKQ